MRSSALVRPGRIALRLALDVRAARRRRTLLGAYWALLLPLLESGAFTLVFGLLLRVRGTPLDYLPFVYVGVLAWRIFARGVVSGAGSMARHASTLHMFPAPAAVLIGGSVGAAALDGLIGLPALFAVVLAIQGVPAIDGLLLWLPVGLALHPATMLGLGLLAGIANAFYRDVGILLSPALAVLMFAVPVVYPPNLVPGSLRLLVLSNPMAAAIEAYRAAVLGTEAPPVGALVIAGALALLILALGVAAARHLDSRAREMV